MCVFFAFVMTVIQIERNTTHQVNGQTVYYQYPKDQLHIIQFARVDTNKIAAMKCIHWWMAVVGRNIYIRSINLEKSMKWRYVACSMDIILSKNPS